MVFDKLGSVFCIANAKNIVDLILIADNRAMFDITGTKHYVLDPRAMRVYVVEEACAGTQGSVSSYANTNPMAAPFSNISAFLRLGIRDM
jgi:hypothetical protein